MGAPPIQGAPPSPVAPVALQQQGMVARARIKALLARRMLEDALPVLTSGSEDGQAIVKALSALKSVGEPSDPGLQVSEAQAEAPPGGPGAMAPLGPPPGGMGMAGPGPGTAFPG